MTKIHNTNNTKFLGGCGTTEIFIASENAKWLQLLWKSLAVSYKRKYTMCSINCAPWYAPKWVENLFHIITCLLCNITCLCPFDTKMIKIKSLALRSKCLMEAGRKVNNHNGCLCINSYWHGFPSVFQQFIVLCVVAVFRAACFLTALVRV